MFRFLCVLCGIVVQAQSIQLGNRQWQYTEIQQLTIAPDGIRVLTYAGKHFKFPAVENWKQLRDEAAPHLERRLVTAYAEAPATPLYRFPAWHSHVKGGCQG